MNEIFSHNLRNVLYITGHTQAELSKAVKVSETSVSHWINGVTVPRPKMVDAVCKYLRCTREDLMVDHDREVSLAPEDLLADAMKDRHDLYGLFNALLKMNDSDLKLVADFVKRLSL